MYAYVTFSEIVFGVRLNQTPMSSANVKLTVVACNNLVPQDILDYTSQVLRKQKTTKN